MSSRRRQIAARRRNKQTGSPHPGEPVFLAVGLLQKPHGLRGELLMRVMTDFPERLTPGVLVYLGESHQEVHIRSVRKHNKGLLVAFDEFPGLDEVDHIRNQWLFVRADDRPPLPEGEYYRHELIGLRVSSDDGQALGQLIEILETGANDVYVVRQEDGKDVLLPAIEDVVLAIDLDKKEMRVHLLPGLID